MTIAFVRTPIGTEFARRQSAKSRRSTAVPKSPTIYACDIV